MSDCLALVVESDGTDRICGRHLERDYPAVYCPGCLASLVLTAAVTSSLEGFACFGPTYHLLAELSFDDALETAGLIYAEDTATLARFPRQLAATP